MAGVRCASVLSRCGGRVLPSVGRGNSVVSGSYCCSNSCQLYGYNGRNFSNTSATQGAKVHIVRSKEELPVLNTSSHNYTINLLRNSHQWKDKVALVCSMTGAQTTYSQLTDQLARWGGYLHQMGLGAGHVVAVMAPNLNEYAPVALGTAAVGAVITGVNPTYTPDEVATQLTDSGARLVVVFGPMEGIVRKAFQVMGRELPLVSMGPNTGTGLTQATEVLNDDRIKFADPVEVKATDTLALMYSSGTTGKPKGALISHSGAFTNLSMVTHPSFLSGSNTYVDGDDQGSMLQLLPLYHVAGLLGVCAVGLQGGARMVNYPKFDPKNYLQVLQDYKVSELPVVPAILNFMVSHPGCDSRTLQSVRSILCGTAPLSNAALEILLKKVGRSVVFQQGYGLTELLFATMDPNGEYRTGYTGQLLPGITAKVVDLSDGVSTLPHGQDGEICIKSPSVMQGYLNCPEETASTVDPDGWLHTGDVGHYDQDGYFKIVDRTKELIKVKSFQVSPSELEDVLLQLPGVVEASVVGVPHPKLGEAPRAYLVVVKPLKHKEIVSHMAIKLAPHKQLEGGVEFVSALPRNATGKVLKRELVRMAMESKA